MRLLVIGAGSTGGYLGTRLAQAGRDVTFLVRPERAAQIRESGLRIISPFGDTIFHPTFITAETITKPYDIILVTVKAFQLDAALDAFSPAVGRNTMILPVLNGMRHMDILSERFPHNVIGGALRVMTVLEEDGRIIQLSLLQELAYGELDGSLTPRIQALDAFLRSAQIGARLSSCVRREMWEKWILLSALGAVTCLMRGLIGEVEACPEGKAFALQILDEIVAIVRAVGEAPSDNFLTATRQQIIAKGSSVASSMYRDIERGRSIEVEEIIGDMVRRGKKVGINAPLLSAAYAHLCIYQNRVKAA